VEALLGEPEGGGSFTRDPEGCLKALEIGISLHRDPAGEPGKGLIYQGVRKTEGSGNIACLLWELCEGNPEGGLL